MHGIQKTLETSERQDIRAMYNAPRALHIQERRLDQGSGRKLVGHDLPEYGGRMVPGIVCRRESHMRVHIPHHRKGMQVQAYSGGRIHVAHIV